MPERWEVFIVEDDQLLASALTTAVEYSGYRVRGVAYSESDAVARVLSASRCIVIMDVNLGPGGSGYHAALSIRRERDDPIIFHTAYGDAEFRRQIATLGNVQLLQKPVPYAVLEEALQAASA